MPIADYKMAAYKATAHKRWLRDQDELSLSDDRAWTVAKKAAARLRSQFGVQRVVVIGSLTHQQRYHRRSDVDLVVWELPEKKYYRAVAQLLHLDPRHEIDLVRVRMFPTPLKNILIENASNCDIRIYRILGQAK